ncbi:hypothetical protein T440DRAFT_536505 [Plenodomus tracheiphilus IPT5]|uniref:Uncharacterized protein n=1 Tax=Plenodomus tracheiphilus IPT5 TaxID=1408161 RepID=A0A6A7B1Z0_9PLEO|nr:hypothetical protein T440DRAFT_536505 [Plenodomus tracheiphilus IPT5]
MPEPAHKPQVKSYHRSDYTFGRSTRVIPRRDSSGQQHEQFAQQFAGEMMGEGHTQNSRGQETQQSLRNVRLDGIGESRQVPQSGRATPSPSAQPGSGGTTSDPNAPAGRIRLRIEWESTTINVWLDMDAPGEAFFQAFQKAAGKKHTLERDETSLLLKKDKKSSDKDEYTLLLGADELDADWETTLEWLRNHMAEKPPNIYGKVDVGDR